ncbi:MAG TPA: hypothetical protein VH475_23925 [Tepidisphaeraceae bacterium]
MATINPVYTSSHPFSLVEQPEPANRREAQREFKELGVDIGAIDMQLGQPPQCDASGQRLSHEAREEWRRKAKAAKRFKNERRLFLRDWLANHPHDERSIGGESPSIGATAQARSLSRVVAKLEGVFVSARRFCEHPTPDHHAALARSVSEVLQGEREAE